MHCGWLLPRPQRTLSCERGPIACSCCAAIHAVQPASIAASTPQQYDNSTYVKPMSSQTWNGAGLQHMGSAVVPHLSVSTLGPQDRAEGGCRPVLYLGVCAQRPQEGDKGLKVGLAVALEVVAAAVPGGHKRANMLGPAYLRIRLRGKPRRCDLGRQRIRVDADGAVPSDVYGIAVHCMACEGCV